LQLELASPQGLVRILSSVVSAQPLLMASGEAEFRLRSTAESQLVGHEQLRREALLLQQFAHELHGCDLVTSPLHEQVENLALAVHCSPEPKLLGTDHHSHLVEMPLRGRAGATAAKLSSKKSGPNFSTQRLIVS
jgi:hypothetical protein